MTSPMTPFGKDELARQMGGRMIGVLNDALDVTKDKAQHGDVVECFLVASANTVLSVLNQCSPGDVFYQNVVLQVQKMVNGALRIEDVRAKSAEPTQEQEGE